MWEWIATNVTFDRIVGIFSLVASLAALWAARTARQVAKETQDQIGVIRFSDEIAKLRRSAETLRNAARKGNWDHAREQCDELLTKAAELGEKFEEADRDARGTKTTRFAIEVRLIAREFETALVQTEVEGDMSAIHHRIAKQIEILSKVYGSAQKDMEAKIGKH